MVKKKMSITVLELVEHETITGVPQGIFALRKNRSMWVVTHVPTGLLLDKLPGSLERVSERVRSWWKTQSKEDREKWKKLTLDKTLKIATKEQGLDRPLF